MTYIPVYRADSRIGPTVVTCLEIRWPRPSGFSGPVPSRYSQPRAGRAATECERGRVSALVGTPSADSARWTDVPITAVNVRGLSGSACAALSSLCVVAAGRTRGVQGGKAFGTAHLRGLLPARLTTGGS